MAVRDFTEIGGTICEATLTLFSGGMMEEEFCGNLFDFPKMQINKKIRLIELFGGIGSQAMALRDIGADFETYRLVEFDKYAVQSYNAIHKTNFTTMDIRDVHGSDLGIVEKSTYTYLLTYSFPCTDLSVAGQMKGMSKKDWEKGESTRSGLLWEVERILKELPKEQLPDILLMENVPQVHAEQNKVDFENWLSFLRSKGYHNFWQDLNAKDYGIPQNRERCFCISILSDDFVEFEFPKQIKLTTVMKDYLEESVDEKYYISGEKADKLIADLIDRGVLRTEEQKNRRTEEQKNRRTEELALTLHSTEAEKSLSHHALSQDMTQESVRTNLKEGVCVKQLGFIEKGTGKHQTNIVYDKNGLCPTQYAALWKEPFKVVDKW